MGSNSGDTDATPYVCQLCRTCVATSASHVETRGDVVIFRRLHPSVSADNGTKTVKCPSCEQPVGARGDNNYQLRKERVTKRLEPLHIAVYSLKEQEISELTPVLREVFPNCNVTSKVLAKAELRGYSIDKLRPSPDFVVVVHRSEGRVLLTDRNGFYHDVLGSAYAETCGNVLVVVTRVEAKADSELFDAALLRNLSTQGDQPTVGALSAAGRVLTWESTPSRPQLQQLQMLTSKAYFREPLAVVQGIPAQWSKTPPKGSANSTWCTLL